MKQMQISEPCSSQINKQGLYSDYAMDSSIRGPTPDKADDLFFKTSRYVLGPICRPPIKHVMTILSLRERWPDCEACHSPPSSVDDKKERICTLLPLYAFTSHKNTVLPLIWAFNNHCRFVPTLSSSGNSGQDDGNDRRSRDTGGSGTDVDRNPNPLSHRFHIWNVFQQMIYTPVQNGMAPAHRLDNSYRPLVRVWQAKT